MSPDMTLLDRMVFAVERVCDRLARATAALEAAGVPYAVVGGNAVAAWVATIDASATRNTPDVDILVERSDVERAAGALEDVGFVRTRLAGWNVDAFLDGPDAKSRDAVHIIVANEKLANDSPFMPRVTEADGLGNIRVLALPALVQMKLASFRLKDRVHLRDLLDVGLIDKSWIAGLGPDLGARLQQLIDTPDQ